MARPTVRKCGKRTPRDHTALMVWHPGAFWPPRKGRRSLLFRGSRKLDDSALQPDHGCVRSVIGAELEQDTLDRTFYALFLDVELSRDLLVRIAPGNQVEDSDFTWG